MDDLAKLQVDIELENVVRSSEARSQASKATADKALKDLEEVRRKLQEEEHSRQAIENELQALKSSSSMSISEMGTLRARIASLEISNRETLAILDTKSSANVELAQDLQKQHKKNVELKQEISSLSQSVQSAQATAASSKFREQSLQQELEFARRNNEWFETELKTKSAEALKCRKEKGARIAELQRLNEECTSNSESLTRSEQQLRSRLEEAQHKQDDALAKVQQLQEAAARTEEGFRAEVEASKRLVELKQQQTDTSRQRLKEVELRLEQVKDEGADEVRRIRQELEQSREDVNESEQRAQNLGFEVDRLQAMLASQSTQPGSAPQTPRPNGSLLRAASPFGTPGSIRGRSTLTTTQLMEELYKKTASESSLKRQNQALSHELDEIMNALEAKQPEFEDLQEEAERLRNENVQMTRIADESFQERDIASKAAKKAEAANKKAQAEIQILQAQLRDLSTQIQLLIFNMHAREKGYDQLTEEEARQFQRLQKGQITEDSLDDMSDTHQFISEKFVAFKDIQELQSQNEELLSMTRRLAIEMESAAEAKEQLEALRSQEEVTSLRDTVATLQDEVQSMTIRLKTYMTERDMFRRLLQQKASAAEINEGLAQSADGSQREVLASIEQQSTINEDDMTIALRELQNNFDSYRTEQSTDRQTMREQLEKLSTERSSLHAEIAKLKSQLTLASERFEMLHSNYAALQRENQELQKRSQTVSESAAKQDIRIQQTAEDLIETRGMLESMRNENANLKAEKTLWRDIQERLSSENESLMQEKSRLNGHLSSQQSLQNERDLSESEMKRRLQSQVDKLETELTSTKRRLSEEVEAAKNLQLRKEFDAQQAQKRIDDLLASISQNKDELVATKTSRDYLQARVDELTIEVRNAEERAQRLQPRPTPRVSQPDGEGDLSVRIEELEEEASELKRELQLAKSQLEHATSRADSFKELAQTAEEDLNSLNEAQEQYRLEMDNAEVEKNSKIAELEQRAEDLSAELANSNAQLTAIRDAQAEVSRRADDEKRVLEAQIAQLKDDEDRYKEEKKWHQSDLRAQADIAAKAQQDYEQQLVKHGEATKELHSVRAEYNRLRTEIASLTAVAESAKLSLSQSESSFEEQRQQGEHERFEIKKQLDDAKAQIELLYQRHDKNAAQLVALQESRASLGNEDPSTPSADVDSATGHFDELTKYLRREKEIAEVQFEMKTQEASRLQQQLDYARSQLDETRLKLEQEQKSQANGSRASLSHKELMDKLNELNLLRESNVTLRTEAQQAQERLVQKTAKVEQLEASIHPLEARVRELEEQKGFMEEEMKQISADREHWQKRTQDILSKYDRVDPAEMDQLQQTIANLELERDTLKQAEAPLTQKIDELKTAAEGERSQWKETRQRLIDQAKEKARQQTASIRDLNSQKAELQDQVNGANEKLVSAENSLATIAAEKSALESQISALQQQAQSTSTDAAAPAPAVVEHDANLEQVTILQQELSSLRDELEAVQAQKAEIEQELESLRAQLMSAVAERDQAMAQTQQPARPDGDVPMQNGSEAHPDATAISDSTRQDLEAAVAVAEARVAELEQAAKEVEERGQTTIKETIKERSDKMKDVLNKKLKESKEKAEKELLGEKEKLQQEYELRLTQEKQIWMAEHSVAAAPQSSVPETPSKPTDVPPRTPTAGLPTVDWSKLGDAETRDLLANNATVKSILTSNIKKKVDIETKRAREEVEQILKAEFEAKITAARDSGQMMAEKKASLRLNMFENRFKTASAKIDVVSTAAKDTPERPVGEVWNIAKDAKPAPAAAAPAAASIASSTPVSTPSTVSPAVAASRTSQAATTVPQPNVPLAASSSPASLVTTGGVDNPFAPHPNNPAATPNPFGASQGTQGAQASQAQRSGIPVPGGSRGAAANRGNARGGVHQRGQGNLRGRGGGQSRNPSGTGLDPSAANFNPGNKRPRESEAGASGAGAKRARGGAQGH